MPSVNYTESAMQSYDIVQWRSAFLKYATCYLAQKQQEATDILAYLQFILDMYEEVKGVAWRQYDVSFRQLRGENGWPWTQVDNTGYTRCVAATLALNVAAQQSPQQQRDFQGQGRQQGRQQNNSKQDPDHIQSHKRLVPNGLCRNFSVGRCTKQDQECNWQHSCFKCRQRHQSLTCSASAPAGSPPTPARYGQQPGRGQPPKPSKAV